MANSIKPFLMFYGQAEEAMNFYISLFPKSRVIDIVRYTAGQAGPEGTVMKAVFSIAGQEVMCIDSPMKHAFGFTPAISLFVECASEEELVRVTNALLEGGQALMPLDNYGFSKKFAWVNDRFGVSWQLNLQ